MRGSRRLGGGNLEIDLQHDAQTLLAGEPEGSAFVVLAARNLMQYHTVGRQDLIEQDDRKMKVIFE